MDAVCSGLGNKVHYGSRSQTENTSYTLFWILNSFTMSGGGFRAKLPLLSAREIMPSMRTKIAAGIAASATITVVVESGAVPGRTGQGAA